MDAQKNVFRTALARHERRRLRGRKPVQSEYNLGLTAFDCGIPLDPTWPAGRQEGWRQAWADREDALGVQAYRDGKGLDPAWSPERQLGWEAEREGHAERVARNSRLGDTTPAACGYSDCSECYAN